MSRMPREATGGHGNHRRAQGGLCKGLVGRGVLRFDLHRSWRIRGSQRCWATISPAWVAFLAAALLLGTAQFAAAQAADAPALTPAEQLEAMGLTRVARSRSRSRWLAAEEMQLLALLEEVPALGERVAAANEELQHALRQQSEAQQARGELGPPRPFESLESTQAAAELVAARTDLIRAVLEFRRINSGLAGIYSQLEDDENVRAALSQLGRRHQLGPERSYEEELVSGEIAERERVAMSLEIPLAPAGNQWQVCGLLNDQTPISFVLGTNVYMQESGNPQFLLTSNDLELAGLSVSEDAQESYVVLPDASGDPQRYTLRAIALPPLRFGGVVLDGLEALVLPPECEHLGSRLPREVFEQRGYSLEQPEPGVRLRIVPSS